MNRSETVKAARALFIAGLVLFLVGTWAAWQVMSGAGEPRVLMLGALGLSVVAFAIGAWRLYTRVDWDRVDAEQRLWDSGPLGRRWLRIRKGLFWND
jgi:hypothetical protein